MRNGKDKKRTVLVLTDFEKDTAERVYGDLCKRFLDADAVVCSVPEFADADDFATDLYIKAHKATHFLPDVPEIDNSLETLKNELARQFHLEIIPRKLFEGALKLITFCWLKDMLESEDYEALSYMKERFAEDGLTFDPQELLQEAGDDPMVKKFLKMQ